MCANMCEYVTNLVVNHCPRCSNTLQLSGSRPELLLSLLSHGATKTELWSSSRSPAATGCCSPSVRRWRAPRPATEAVSPPPAIFRSSLLQILQPLHTGHQHNLVITTNINAMSNTHPPEAAVSQQQQRLTTHVPGPGPGFPRST